MATKRKSKKRKPLTRDIVLRAAVTLVDEQGLAQFSMRKLGQALHVEAMSLYNHVSNKDDILDGLVELVVAEIEFPQDSDMEWREALTLSVHSFHAVCLAHPWVCALLEGRESVGPARLRYYEWRIRMLREAGFDIELAYQAGIAIDAYIYGFLIQEISWPFETVEERAELVEDMAEGFDMERFPYLGEMMGHVMARRSGPKDLPPEDRYAEEFLFGLNLVLDGLERKRLKRATGGTSDA